MLIPALICGALSGFGAAVLGVCRGGVILEQDAFRYDARETALLDEPHRRIPRKQEQEAVAGKLGAAELSVPHSVGGKR